MNNYKITIQYDGTRYKGWQGQNSTGLTIQGKIEAVLGQMAETRGGSHRFGENGCGRACQRPGGKFSY